MLGWCLAALDEAPRIGSVVVVAPADAVGLFAAHLPETSVPITVVAGGQTRAESVAYGLLEAPTAATTILVHDAARPLLTPQIIGAVLDGIGDADGAIAAAPLVDTPKVVDRAGMITAGADRASLWAAQTPQAFVADVFRAAVAAASAAGTLAQATDCAALVEVNGGRVRVVEVTAANLKVTRPVDLLVAEHLLGDRAR